MGIFDTLALAGFLTVCIGAGALGGAFTARSVKTWYPTLRKPSWNPPSWVFGPVWTALYICMGIAGWLVWREGAIMGLPGVLFAVQLGLNVVWSWLFFFRQRPDRAFAEILVLLAAVLTTTLVFWPISQAAGLLFVPYLLWVGFASVLNAAVRRLNPRVTLTVQPGATGKYR